MSVSRKSTFSWCEGAYAGWQCGCRGWWWEASLRLNLAFIKRSSPINNEASEGWRALWCGVHRHEDTITMDYKNHNDGALMKCCAGRQWRRELCNCERKLERMKRMQNSGLWLPKVHVLNRQTQTAVFSRTRKAEDVDAILSVVGR